MNRGPQKSAYVYNINVDVIASESRKNGLEATKRSGSPIYTSDKKRGDFIQ